MLAAGLSLVLVAGFDDSIVRCLDAVVRCLDAGGWLELSAGGWLMLSEL